MSPAYDSVDPFRLTPDPDAYVPRRAGEEALAALAAFLRVGAPQIALRGPPGIGKTLLLRVIADRLAGHLTVVQVPYPVLPPEEICSWILGLIGETPGNDDERTLISLARRLRENGSGLAILIDDAGSMPLPTVRRISRVASEARPALRLVFVLPDDAKGDEVIEALGPGVESVPFTELMNRRETAAYVRARLARARVPDGVHRGFDDAVLDAIHEDAEGIPQLVNTLALEWLSRISARIVEDAQKGGPRATAAARAEAGDPRESRLGSALLGPSGPGVDDPWLAPGSESPTERVADSSAEPAPTLRPAPDTGAPPNPLAPPARRPSAPRSPRRVALAVAAGAGLFALGISVGRMSVPGPAPSPVGDRLALEEPEAKASEESRPAPFLERTPLPDVSAAAPLHPLEAVVAAAEDELEEELAVEAWIGEEASAPGIAAEQTAPATSEEVALATPDEVGPPAAEPAFETDGASPPAAEPTLELALVDAGEIANGAPVRVDAAESAPPPVLVSVNASPWAAIEVDGRDVGLTPLADLPMEEGEHEFRAALPDGRVFVRTVRVTPLNRRVIFP
ncbi:MAG: AAA family ATPase [Proteobacteria bacterium]|nr:AAA family ATPase [Pseudomonadota bacterium]